MTERSILFSAPMVRAILAGTKTQTRRIAKFKPLAPGLNMGFTGLQADKFGGAWALVSRGAGGCWNERTKPLRCPYGVTGDRLWVRETHAFGPSDSRCLVPGESGGTLRWPLCTYKADGGMKRCDTPWRGEFHEWRPSIHMPRWASRITLEVTGVRVERLNGISEADAQAEGVARDACLQGVYRWGFQSLWESINGPGSWAANPWVWCVEFKRVT